MKKSSFALATTLVVAMIFVFLLSAGIASFAAAALGFVEGDDPDFHGSEVQLYRSERDTEDTNSTSIKSKKKQGPGVLGLQEARRKENAAKYAALAEIKKKVAEKQLVLVEKELTMYDQKHKKEMEHLDLLIKAEKLEIELKKTQIEKSKKSR